MPDIENVVIGAEGKATFGGTDWCATNISMNIERNTVPVTSTCDWNPTRKMVGLKSRTISERITGSFEFDWDKTKDPVPALIDIGDGADDVEGSIQVYDGKTLTGTFQIGAVSWTQGVDGVAHVTVPFATQGSDYSWA